MAVNKPVKKGTNQTEKKAKGLLANVGDYSGKTLNLTKKQLGSAGMKAASTRKIAISRTTYDKASKKVLGPMGKPITGRVDLGGGNIAVYKNGVRVRAQKPATGPVTKKPTNPPAPPRTDMAKRYEERKGTVGGNAVRSRKTPGDSYRGAPDRIDRADSRGLPLTGVEGQVITRGGRKYRYSRTSMFGPKKFAWTEFK